MLLRSALGHNYHVSGSVCKCLVGFGITANHGMLRQVCEVTFTHKVQVTFIMPCEPLRRLSGEQWSAFRYPSPLQTLDNSNSSVGINGAKQAESIDCASCKHEAELGKGSSKWCIY